MYSNAHEEKYSKTGNGNDANALAMAKRAKMEKDWGE